MLVRLAGFGLVAFAVWVFFLMDRKGHLSSIEKKAVVLFG